MRPLQTKNFHTEKEAIEKMKMPPTESDKGLVSKIYQ